MVVFHSCVNVYQRVTGGWYLSLTRWPETLKIAEAQVEIEDKVAKLRQRLEEEGPFDVLIGFSQGRMEMDGRPSEGGTILVDPAPWILNGFMIAWWSHDDHIGHL